MKTSVARKVLAESPFLRLPGIELNRLDYGEAICRLPPEEIEATLRQIRALV